MLHFMTDAPVFVVREIIALVPRASVEDSGWESPAWSSSIVHVPEDDAMSVVKALYRVAKIVRPAGRARIAIADPTFAMAAARIDRGGGSPASAAFAR